MPPHLEGLHSIAGVAAAKESCLPGPAMKGSWRSISTTNTSGQWPTDITRKKITYSATDEGCALHPDLWASDISPSRSGTVSLYSSYRGSADPGDPAYPGGAQCRQQSGGAAMAFAAGCTIETIAAGLEDFRPG